MLSFSRGTDGSTVLKLVKCIEKMIKRFSHECQFKIDTGISSCIFYSELYAIYVGISFVSEVFFEPAIYKTLISNRFSVPKVDTLFCIQVQMPV